MEKCKETRRKRALKGALIAAISALLLASSITITALPNGWKTVFSAVGLTEFGDRAEAYPFAFHVLNIGKADALLLTCEGSAMLVDCGRNDDGEQVARYIKKRGIAHLDYAVGTHPDSDHIGGFPALLRELSVNCYLEPPTLKPEKQSFEQQAMDRVLEERNILRKTMQAGDRFALGPAKVEVLSPRELSEEDNDNSLVLRVVYGETSFLLMGDAEQKAEQTLIASKQELSADVLKIGHHGSKTSTSERFLRAVSPEWAAVSAYPDWSNLPNDETLRRLDTHRIKTVRTDTDGVLIFGSDGHTIEVLTENGK